MNGNTCVVCGRRETSGSSFICDPDLARLDDQLSGLPGKVARLTLQLVPAAGAATGERVAMSRTETPLPLRLEALNLAGPGSDTLSAAAMAGMLHPHVRRWRTVENVIVTGPSGTRRECEIVRWHQEIVRDSDGQVMQILHDDQVGLVPPAPWAHSWAAQFQQLFAHHRRKPRPLSSWEKSERTAQRQHMRPADAAQRQKAANSMLGLLPATSNRDPVADEHRTRFGDQAPLERGFALAEDIRYLRQWLPQAANRHELDLGLFATQLRALSEELTRVLGERPDQQWIGRCPAQLTDRETGTARACGAGIWQDPFASQVTCLRCRSIWGPKVVELISLAIDIRKTWPVDRRRRYSFSETTTIGPVRCPACTAAADVLWKDVTATGDTERWYTAAALQCTGSGCTNTRLP